MGGYDPVAAIYDGHWGLEFAGTAREVFDRHLRPRLAPRSAVLDLCCGTGLMLGHLRESGFAAFGVDESEQMLEVARRNAPGAVLQRADMAEFHWDARFGGAVSFYNSLNHARSVEHLRATMQNVARHLAPGGYFLFDYMLPEAFENYWEWREEAAGEGGPRVLEYRYESSTGQATCVVDGEASIAQISIFPEEIRAALGAAGISVVEEMPMADCYPVGARQMVLARGQ